VNLCIPLGVSGEVGVPSRYESPLGFFRGQHTKVFSKLSELGRLFVASISRVASRLQLDALDRLHPGGMTAAGDRDGALGVLDDELEAQVAPLSANMT
jgi:hypothetical protein